MLDFIVAEALYIILMFLLFACISFVTIGIAYAVFVLCGVVRVGSDRLI